MCDDVTESKVIPSIASAFPYVMMLSAFFLVGQLFLSINGLLIVELLDGAKYDTLGEIVVLGVIGKWSQILELIPGAGILTLIFFGSIIAGFVLNIFSQFLSSVGCWAIQLLLRACFWIDPTKTEGIDFFTGAKFMSPEYAKFTAWLLGHRAEKLQWEWEIFNYYLYWGISANALIFTILTYLLAPSPAFWLPLIGFLILATYSLIGRSMTLANFHSFCLKKMGK
ncbi:MAG: hypothetical protein HY284_07435 [Nitrospirae bacterium]|nr:hypothetical protein [Nitrospirota bacterium]